MIKPWKTVSSRAQGDFRIFTLRADRVISPRTGEELDFYVIDCVDWVNVIAVTPEDQLVLVEQYRHGTASIELEIPGGMMDRGDGSPVETAVRELREETGYEGEKARVIGRIAPNPAIMSNTCHTVLIENCRPRHPVQWDHGEEMHTQLVAASELETWVARGRFRHSLVVVALFQYDLWRRGVK